MKINITITKEGSKEKLSLELPSSYHDIEFDKFISLNDCGDDIIKIVSLFTGLDEHTVRSAEIHNLNAVIACLSFLNTAPQYKLPSTILGYSIADNLETKSIAQYADLQGILKGLKENDSAHNYSLFPIIVATYAVNPYDFAKAEAIKNQFLKAPCTEVLAVANFTLVKFRALNHGIGKTYRHQVTHPSRLRLAMSGWLQNLTSTIRYYTWKMSLPSSERNFLNGL